VKTKKIQEALARKAATSTSTSNKAGQGGSQVHSQNQHQSGQEQQNPRRNDNESGNWTGAQIVGLNFPPLQGNFLNNQEDSQNTETSGISNTLNYSLSTTF